MSLSRYEKETIIIFNEEEANARVETFNGRLIREIEKAGSKSSDVTIEEREADRGVYIIPKKFIKVRAPLKLSEEQRTVMAARGKENYAKMLETVAKTKL